MDFPVKISAATLAKKQQEVGSVLKTFCVDETASTNSDAAKMLFEKTTSESFVVIANRQTNGRGRIGRKWESASAGNLYLSCGFRPRIAPQQVANFTLWLGVSLARMLREKMNVPACVKWPNDIFCSGKKLAGMLTEVHLDATNVRGLVFGLGLNVNLNSTELPESIRTIATSLRIERGGLDSLDIHRVCAETLLAIETAYEFFLSGTHTQKLMACWRDFDLLSGKTVTAIYGDEEIIGTADGIDAQGRIQIKTPAGTRIAFAAGDVSLKKI